MIILKKRFDEMGVGNKVSLSGHFQIYKRHYLEKENQLIAEFDNLLLDSGLNGFGTSTGERFNYCQVGTGNSTPAVGQVALDTQVGAIVHSGGAFVTSHGVDDITGDYWASTTFTYPGTLGQIVGNISEIGVSIVNNNSQPLTSRALILDNSGNPTTITLLATEYLTIIYTIKVYPYLSDTIGSFLINGETYEFISRPFKVNTSFWAIQGTNYLGGGIGASNYLLFANATINEITSTGLSGVSMSLASMTPSYGYATLDPYVNNSLKNSTTLLIAQNYGNHANGISGFNITGEGYPLYYPGTTSCAAFQVLLDHPIPKNADRTLAISNEMSWGRKV